MTIQSNPWTVFSSSKSDLKQGSYDVNSITFTADQLIEQGDIEVSFGGLLNPRSFSPSSLFEAETYDKDGNVVG